MTFVLTLVAAAGASGVELLEALAIVLGVGVARGFWNALLGGLAGGLSVLVLCLVMGPALRAGGEHCSGAIDRRQPAVAVWA